MRIYEKPLRLLILIITLLVSVFMAARLIAIVGASYRMFEDYRNAQAIISDEFSLLTLVELNETIHAFDEHYDRFYARVRSLSRLGKVLAWVPVYGGTFQQAPQLLDLVDDSLETGIVVYDDILPTLEEHDTDASPLTMVPALSEALAKYDDQLLSQLDAIVLSIETLDLETLHPSIARPLIEVQALLPLLRAGVQLSSHLPEIAGFGDSSDAERNYLILALNEDELRPGGGFISSVGEVVIHNADLSAVSFSDAYTADDWTQPYPLAPDPLRDFMGLQLWVFRDSNWSPDFPASAEQGLMVYRPEERLEEYHGVIAVDQYSVQELVRALGGIRVPDSDESIRADEVIDYMRASYALDEGETIAEWWPQRKNFAGEIAILIVNRISDGDVDWSSLGETIVTLLDEHHIQVYLRDDDENAILAAYGWNGQVKTPVSDHFLIAEANLSYNKSSSMLSRAFWYTVDLSQKQPLATLSAQYTNNGTGDILCVNESAYTPTYEGRMNQCSWVYLQVYVPQGSILVSYSEHPIAATNLMTGLSWPGIPVIRQETDVPLTTAFDQAFLLPTQSETTTLFTYQLPARVMFDRDGKAYYSLYVQKQAGLGAIPLSIEVLLPENAEIVDNDSPFVESGQGSWSMDTILDQDVVIKISYIIQE